MSAMNRDPSRQLFPESLGEETGRQRLRGRRVLVVGAQALAAGFLAERFGEQLAAGIHGGRAHCTASGSSMSTSKFSRKRLTIM